ncbi:hypothetical protein QU38_01645, partial [Staphylococcus aureus]
FVPDAGQRLRGARREIGIAGGDLGDVVAGPAILHPGAVSRGRLVEPVADIGIADRVEVGIAFPDDAAAVQFVIFLDALRIAVGPDPLAARLDDQIIGARTFHRDIGRTSGVPGVDRLAAIGRDAAHGRPGDRRHAPVGALAPFVVIV